MGTEQDLEERLKAQSTAPRVTQADVEAAIVSEHYFSAAEGFAGANMRQALRDAGDVPSHSFSMNHVVMDDCPLPLKLMTFCVLVLSNGFMVTGQSAAASPENFDPKIGREIAKRNAVSQAWGHMGFLLRSRLVEREELLARAPIPASSHGAVTYVGTKVVHAVPCKRGDYNDLRGWKRIETEENDADGYIVEYADSGVDQSKVDSLKDPLQAVHQGYVSWSPKDVFERAYRPLAPVTGALVSADDADGTKQ